MVWIASKSGKWKPKVHFKRDLRDSRRKNKRVELGEKHDSFWFSFLFSNCHKVCGHSRLYWKGSLKDNENSQEPSFFKDYKLFWVDSIKGKENNKCWSQVRRGMQMSCEIISKRKSNRRNVEMVLGFVAAINSWAKCIDTTWTSTKYWSSFSGNLHFFYVTSSILLLIIAIF